MRVVRRDRDSSVTEERRPSRALVQAIHQAATEEIFDAREWLPGLDQDRARVKHLSAAARKADVALRDLERICNLVSLHVSRERLLERVHDLRFLLLEPHDGWLVRDQLPTRGNGHPLNRQRRASRVRALIEQGQRDGMTRADVLEQIGYQWARDFRAHHTSLSPGAFQRLWGRSKLPPNPDRAAALITEQLRKLLQRTQRRDKTSER